MAHYNVTLNQFNGGEISSRGQSRTDLNAYNKSLDICENFLPTAEGQLSKRPGSRYLGSVSDATERHFFARFKFSEDDAYALEFSDQLMRVWKLDGTLALDASGNVYELSTPYAIADFYDADGAIRFDFDQSADTIYIVHEDYAPRTLLRNGDADWTLTTITFIDGPYEAENATAVTMTPSGTTGAITVTASSATFVANDVGRFIRIGHTNQWGYGIITGFTSSTQVSVTVQSTLYGTTAVTSWRLGLYSTDNGYPSCVGFVQDRLVFAGLAAREYANRFDMSATGQYLNFAPNELPDSGSGAWVVTDATAISRSLTGKINNIRWIEDDRQGMILGTSGGVWLVSPSNRNESITPSNINAVRASGIGTSALTRSVRADDSIVHVQRFRKRLRFVTYSFESDNMLNTDMSRLAEHIGTESKFIKIDYADSPYPMVWALRADGVLCSIIFAPEENIVGWSRHPMPDTVVEDFVILPSTTDDFDQVWWIARRTINGSTARYVERMDDLWEEGELKSDANFVDSAIETAGPITTVTGLSHLEGETVSIQADGNNHPQEVVSGGQITLDYEAATKVIVGLPYTARADFLEMFAEDQKGTSQNYPSKITSMVVRLWNSLGGMFGPPDAADQEILYRDAADDMDSSPPLFTGKLDLESIDDDWQLETQASITHDEPLPFTLSAAYIRFEVSEQ